MYKVFLNITPHCMQCTTYSWNLTLTFIQMPLNLYLCLFEAEF